jgi:HTH-type transcriptional regulator/antitoxin HigA
MEKEKRRLVVERKSQLKVSGGKISSNFKNQLTTEKRKVQIKTKEAYNAVMLEIDKLMKRGEANLSPAELKRLRIMAEAAELYEDAHDPLPLPESLPEMIRMRMFQMQLNQAFTAKLLGVSDAKFSLILSGRQRPDIIFIKALHEKLKVDANLILQAL